MLLYNDSEWTLKRVSSKSHKVSVVGTYANEAAVVNEMLDLQEEKPNDYYWAEQTRSRVLNNR